MSSSDSSSLSSSNLPSSKLDAPPPSPPEGDPVGSPDNNPPRDMRALRAIKIALLVFLLGMFVVNKRKSTWPIVSWALYSEYSTRFQPPKPTALDLELRVYTAKGKRHIINPEQVLTTPRDSLSHDIIERAFTAPPAKTEARMASRRYLVKALSQHLQIDGIKTVQVWEMSYKVTPLSVPPFDREQPSRTVMLGSFSQSDLR